MCLENNKLFHSDEMEKWLKNFFLDPFTSMLDQTQFRVDLFDTSTDMIIEALLPTFLPKEISIYINLNQVIIKASKSKTESFERTITFPCQINTQKITALFSNDILEITISKIHQETKNNQYIPLTH